MVNTSTKIIENVVAIDPENIAQLDGYEFVLSPSLSSVDKKLTLFYPVEPNSYKWNGTTITDLNNLPVDWTPIKNSITNYEKINIMHKKIMTQNDVAPKVY